FRAAHAELAMQQTKISGVFDRHCRWFPASSCLKADRPMRRLRFTRQEGMLGVLFYPRDFGQSPTERLAIPQSGGLETSLHARPHMCDHQFFHQRGTRRGLTGWTREGSSPLLVLA